MIPPQPRATLFPYTTLFRSRKMGTCEAQACSEVALVDGAPCDDVSACTVADACQYGICKGATITCPNSPTPCEASYCDPQIGDRKSTRLNSSHSSISYAVFC